MIIIIILRFRLQYRIKSVYLSQGEIAIRGTEKDRVIRASEGAVPISVLHVAAGLGLGHQGLAGPTLEVEDAAS